MEIGHFVFLGMILINVVCICIILSLPGSGRGTPKRARSEPVYDASPDAGIHNTYLYPKDQQNVQTKTVIDGIAYDISRSRLVVGRDDVDDDGQGRKTVRVFRLFVGIDDNRPFLHVRTIKTYGLGMFINSVEDNWYVFSDKYGLLDGCRWMSEDILRNLMDADLTYHNPWRPS